MDMYDNRKVHSDSFNGFLGWDHRDPQNCVVTAHPTSPPDNDDDDNNGGGGGGGDGGGDDQPDPTDPAPTDFPAHFECCGGHDRPYLWINTHNQQCCAEGQSGVSRPIGEC